MYIIKCNECDHEQETEEIHGMDCECPNCGADLSYDEYYGEIIPEGFTLEKINA